MVFRVSLSFFSLLHWNVRWCTVCMPCLHGLSGLPKIFNRCNYDRIFPWQVIIVVTFGLKFKFTASLLSTLGKNSLVIAPFVVSLHWRCHFLILPFLFHSAFWYPSVCYTVVLSSFSYDISFCLLSRVSVFQVIHEKLSKFLTRISCPLVWTSI